MMTPKNLCMILLVIISQLSYTQTIQQEKMQQLEYMVGDWVGISKQIENGTVKKEVPAYESIHYALDKHIITIDLNSETLVLHTVITYDESDETYYYHPYSKEGIGKYPAKIENGKLVVSPNEEVRYIFTQTQDGNFTEYGEKLVDGVWVKYFEDTFMRKDSD